MTQAPFWPHIVSSASFFVVFLASPIFAQSDGFEGASVEVTQSRLVVTPQKAPEKREWTIPRLFNGIRNVSIAVGDQSFTAAVQPDLTTWKITWQESSIDWSKAKIVLDLDHPMQPTADPLSSEADGSFRLPASQAMTRGSKLRYEPQPFKNTVGYWVDADDFAWWTLKLDRPGKFNVAVLQGCGAGQGGSTVEVLILKEGASDSSGAIKVSFEIQETGHFQNFRWRHLGEIQLNEVAGYRLEVRCAKKAKGAVGDIREIQLVRIP